jgi:hypothetical protein
MVLKKATKILTLAYVDTWVGIGKHYKKSTRLKHLL